MIFPCRKRTSKKYAASAKDRSWMRYFFVPVEPTDTILEVNWKKWKKLSKNM